MTKITDKLEAFWLCYQANQAEIYLQHRGWKKRGRQMSEELEQYEWKCVCQDGRHNKKKEDSI